MKLPEAPHLRELNRSDPQECNLVLAGWLRTYVRQVDRVERNGEDRRVFFSLCEMLVKALLARCTVVVACMPEAHDAVYGWIAFDGSTVHYLVVKPRWQRLGIATWLLRDFADVPVSYSHQTPNGIRLLASLKNTKPWAYVPMARFQEAA